MKKHIYYEWPMIQGQAWVIRFGTSTYMGAISPLGQQYSKPLNHEKKDCITSLKLGKPVYARLMQSNHAKGPHRRM